MSVIAFHEKAGLSQVDLVLSLLGTFFSCRVSHCRHASIRTLEERIISLGACWAFSFQPVLLSVWRPIVSLKSGTRPRRLTQSPELGFGFCLSSSWNDFDLVALPFRFTRLRTRSLGCCCARGRTPLHLPTSDA